MPRWHVGHGIHAARTGAVIAGGARRARSASMLARSQSSGLGYAGSMGKSCRWKAGSRRSTRTGSASEGAPNQGAFHEALNLAALWKLPVLFVIEDNPWAISVPKSKSTAVADNSVRAAAY